MPSDLREKIAVAVATAQNVPLVGPKQWWIAGVVLPLVVEAQADALEAAADHMWTESQQDYMIIRDAGVMQDAATELHARAVALREGGGQ